MIGCHSAKSFLIAVSQYTGVMVHYIKYSDAELRTELFLNPVLRCWVFESELTAGWYFTSIDWCLVNKVRLETRFHRLLETTWINELLDGRSIRIHDYSPSFRLLSQGLMKCGVQTSFCDHSQFQEPQRKWLMPKLAIRDSHVRHL